MESSKHHIQRQHSSIMQRFEKIASIKNSIESRQINEANCVVFGRDEELIYRPIVLFNESTF
jgi:hypothetical protein